MAEFSTYSPFASSLQVLAQAYGTDAYNSNSYNGRSATSQTTPPLPPNTGLHLPSSTADIALLFALALIVGSLSYAITRLLRRRPRHK